MIYLNRLPTSIPRPHLPEDIVAVTGQGKHYSIIRKLGEGAAGVVFEALASGSDGSSIQEKYAIKILCPLQHIVKTEDGYKRIESRFLSEGKRGQGLDAPYLSNIIDTGYIQSGHLLWHGRPFYVMKFVDGITLDSHFSMETLPLARRLKWIRQLGDSINYLHELEILHRDIKPHNILIDKKDDMLVLGDFGVVQWGDLLPQYTDGISTYSSEILTTWNYLPPDVEINPGKYTSQSEMWAFGKTALEILSWRLIPRASILIGNIDFDSICDSKELGQLIKGCLTNEASERPTIKLIMDLLSNYHDKLLMIESLSPENQRVAIESVEKYSPRALTAFYNNLYRKEAISAAQAKRTLPDHFENDEPCKACGSNLTILLTSHENAPEAPIYDHIIFYFVCFGQPGHPCGNIWSMYYDEYTGEKMIQ